MSETESPGGDDGSMPRIVQTADVLGGDPRIEGRRIGVHPIYERYVSGEETPEAIAASYDISVAAVHAALAYAFNNSTQMREIAARNQRLTEETREHRLTPDDNSG